MPGRNIYKQYAPDTYYHVYNRGVNRQLIFKDDQDYAVFLHIVKRYLGAETSNNSQCLPYPNFFGKIELQAFCLMPNHFHFLVYQQNIESMKLAMKSIGVAYAMYFNKRYDRVGPIWQQRYRASLIDSEEYLLTISGYIHLNPADYSNWKWSSLNYYLGNYKSDWILPAKILALFEDTDYLKFLKQVRRQKLMLANIESKLAHYGIL